MAHNRYVNRGGEDRVFDRESALLSSHGHTVCEFTMDNRDIDGTGRLALAAGTIWSQRSYREMIRRIEQFRPDVIHVHNTLPQLSPAIYYAAERMGVPVVQTLHNYRLSCVNGLLQREGRLCEQCIGKTIPWPAVQHGCYRESRTASFAVAGMLMTHRFAGTWKRMVTRYIALSEFSKEKLVQAGIPADRLVVKPNFAQDLRQTAHRESTRRGGVFVGRLSQEKGIKVLIDAWQRIDSNLVVIGDGPEADHLAGLASHGVRRCVNASDQEVAAAMWEASYLVLPSIVYEGFPMVIAEAFAAGLPVIASRLGAMGELVEDGVTGLHFRAGDALDLAEKVKWAEAHPEAMADMGRRARRVYEDRLTPEKNYQRLLEIYTEAQESLHAKPDSEVEGNAKWISA